MEEKENILGYEKIGKLILKFSIPCVISMVVAALYNIVDQIFIGWSEAGAYGNASTNIVFPATVFVMAFALLIGDGSSAYFSLLLGSGNKKRANQTIGNQVLLLAVFAVIITIVGIVFKEGILSLFGADPKEELCFKYAHDYYGIISIGFPFFMIGQGLNSSIRADGSPRYAMICTMSGAITNIILDPIFIFGFHMAMKGAALATILGQVLTFVLSIIYLFRSKNFKITNSNIIPKFGIIGRVLTLGLASFIVQLSIMIVIAVKNRMYTTYGYETIASTGQPYGAIEPLAVSGIVMKVFGIVISIIIGVSIGGLPIIGYNRGAGKIDRVKSAIKQMILIVLGVSFVAFLLFEFAPDLLLSIFGNNNSVEYVEYGRYCFRIFLSGIVLTGFCKTTAIMLQGMGSSVKSIFISLFRELFVLAPATFIIATISHNVVTMLWAALISDVISALLAFIFLRLEIKKVEQSYTEEKKEEVLTNLN